MSLQVWKKKNYQTGASRGSYSTRFWPLGAVAGDGAVAGAIADANKITNTSANTNAIIVSVIVIG